MDFMKNAVVRKNAKLRVIDYCILIKRKNKAEFSFVFSWCRWSESNRHGGLVQWILSPLTYVEVEV